MPLSLLISAWLVGALGGLHCLAMCGGFTTAIAARDDRARGGAAPLLTFAVVGLYRALYLTDSLAQGPFCLVP